MIEFSLYSPPDFSNYIHRITLLASLENVFFGGGGGAPETVLGAYCERTGCVDQQRGDCHFRWRVPAPGGWALSPRRAELTTQMLPFRFLWAVWCPCSSCEWLLPYHVFPGIYTSRPVGFSPTAFIVSDGFSVAFLRGPWQAVLSSADTDGASSPGSLPPPARICPHLAWQLPATVPPHLTCALIEGSNFNINP